MVIVVYCVVGDCFVVGFVLCDCLWLPIVNRACFHPAVDLVCAYGLFVDGGFW